MKIPFYSLLLWVILAGSFSGNQNQARTENWPAWRGPRGDGSSLEQHVPVHWGEGSNLVWKAKLPGSGHASPVVWADRIFTVSANEKTQERLLLCFETDQGKLLWQRTVLSSPLEKTHRLNSYASSTPATDGQQVYTSFLDKDEMVATAYDLTGQMKWQVRPGVFSSMHGYCSSPLLFEDLVILNGDHDGDSYLVALDRKTGKTVWKTKRPNRTRSYCVTTIFELSGRTQMVFSGDKSVASYDPRKGTLHWYLPGPTEQFVASIVYNPSADLLFVTGGFPELHILGLRHDGRGIIGDDHIVWRSHKGVSYVPSPVSAGNYFLVVSDGGFATCFEAATGNIMWQERMGGGHHASLITAEGRVYYLSDQGVMTVVQPKAEFEVLAKNKLDDRFFASPAVSHGRIYLRGEQSLYAIGASSAK
jgi:outer membrane protein assembly factor BamB